MMQATQLKGFVILEYVCPAETPRKTGYHLLKKSGKKEFVQIVHPPVILKDDDFLDTRQIKYIRLSLVALMKKQK
ncbi:MAG: hypothetical protein DWB56_00515 [Candidatus Jettenia sp.]|nr:MAG: hypothetical protein EDM77_07380 [Candidatus Jettenia sp. AMX1]MBC6927435.1 hypothetical protein [Candidatus Jettenia sp.]MCE7879118.1 hypothetical protein [Candidatus Jettenia sp. AMX1]MCQ3925763.1 hypothetical protein [Candidatus Jettenia sp.]